MPAVCVSGDWYRWLTHGVSFKPREAAKMRLLHTSQGGGREGGRAEGGREGKRYPPSSSLVTLQMATIGRESMSPLPVRGHPYN